ncbi:PREDICTED: rho GTPase-activating protein 11A isoform X1 [Tinamus guttatus]|uniref:rho GTPase-activating protein 11A isoform X1 n=1 Tax=Tinamus guttatus TaxID=94827 RepID=UPI00052EF18E|nr:PREDICTED: rho GTPase-activating protein 11A isoform X1 [Tinamus guttatus]
MADRTIEALRFFFNFLRTVSLRSHENRMDSSNLAVIFAPNLMHSGEIEKMTANTEKKIRLQAAVVQTLIDHAAEIGQVPEFISEKIPAMLGIDALQSTPALGGHEDGESESSSECKRRRQRSVGDFVSGALNKFKSNRTSSTTPQQDRSVLSLATPVVLTPSTKRKLPTDCSQGLSSKKRRSFKHSFAFELLPSSIFNSSSTPASVQFDASPCVSLESSQNSLSPSTGGENPLSGTGNRRTKRHASKKLYRAESGKTGCFSPKVSRKEMVRRSLRLKFGLGRSNRDINVASGCAVGNRSENIGRRLASQQDLESRDERAKRDILFSPYISEKFSKKGSKNVSKSEENLLTPKCHDKAAYRMSWNSPVMDFQEISSSERSLTGHCEATVDSSESVFTAGKSSAGDPNSPGTTVNKQDNSLKLFLCEEENNLATETLLKVKEAFSASGNNLQDMITDTKSSLLDVTEETLSETLCLTGLSPEGKKLSETSLANTECRQLIDPVNQSYATDKQESKKDETKALEKRFHSSIEIELQVQKQGAKNVREIVPQGIASEDELTFQNSSLKDDLNKIDSFGEKEEIKLTHTEVTENCTAKCCYLEEDTDKPSEAAQLPISQLSKSGKELGNEYWQAENSDKILTKTAALSDHGKVSDHIQWFNKLSLNDPSSASKTKPPLKFQRTPVRQSVRRMNSLLEANRPSASGRVAQSSAVGSPLVKSLSYDSALSSCTEKPSKNSTALPLKSESASDQVSTSHKQLELTSKSCCRQLNPAEKTDLSMRTAGIYKQKVTVNPSKSVLEDLTNHETVKSSTKVNAGTNIPGAVPEKCAITKNPLGKEKIRYRGSPKNPISKVKLLPATKPVDL